MNVRQIVNLMGGAPKLAKNLGIKSESILSWVNSNRIPSRQIPTLTRLANERGLPLKPEDMEPDISLGIPEVGGIKFKER